MDFGERLLESHDREEMLSIYDDFTKATKIGKDPGGKITYS
jgi:hypothetical protein